MLDKSIITVGLAILLVAAGAGTAMGATSGDAAVAYMEQEGVDDEAQAAAFVGAQVGGAAVGASVGGPTGAVIGYKTGQAAGL